MQKNDLVFRTIVEDVGKFIQVIHLIGSYFLVHGAHIVADYEVQVKMISILSICFLL